MEHEIRIYTGKDEAYMESVGLHVESGVLTTDFPVHRHDFYETFIIIGGSACHILGDREYRLQAGDVFSIKNGMMHGFSRVNSLSLINLMYRPELLSHCNIELHAIPGFDSFFLVEPEMQGKWGFFPLLQLKRKALDDVAAFADFLQELLRREEESVYPVIRQTFLALLSYIAAQYDFGGRRSAQVSSLSRALTYMENHIADPVRLCDIAGSIFVSPRQLERLFEEYFRESPMQHLRQMRMQQARMLLQNTDMGVSEAAAASGFPDASYFTRIFTKTYGMNPQELRRARPGIKAVPETENAE